MMDEMEEPPTPRVELMLAIAAELDHAYAKHGTDPWGRHEFYAILLEEVEELWQAIKADAPMGEVLAELRQVAAMCFRYYETGDRYLGDHPPVPIRERVPRSPFPVPDERPDPGTRCWATRHGQVHAIGEDSMPITITYPEPDGRPPRREVVWLCAACHADATRYLERLGRQELVASPEPR